MIKGLQNVPVKERMTDLIVDLKEFTGDDDSKLRFHEPGSADLFPNSEANKELKKWFPEFTEQMLYQVYLLGRCYVLHPDDKDTQKPAIDFGNLAKSNKEVFFYVLGEFLQHFSVSDFEDKVNEAGNDLAE